MPEQTFASRVEPVPPPRPLPSIRRAIFFDVENTSRPEHIDRVLGHLAIDRLGRQTDLVAVGNWRVASADTARLLARHGAQLVHSAPSTGVRDWSDLRIAVSAGVWLAGARPGDAIEIISDDRAFDAIGDVAAGLGVAFHRVSFRRIAGMAETEAAPRPIESERRSRGGRRGRGRGRGSAPRSHHAPAHHAPPPHQPVHHPRPGHGAEAHTAPHDEIVEVARELIESSGRGAVTLDVLANGLKSRGFRRPPGSPRLITRLRRIRELQISRNGLISLAGGGEPRRDEDEGAREPAAPAPRGSLADESAEPADAVPPDATSAEPPVSEGPPAEGARPAEDAQPVEDAQPTDGARRRSRRRGRRGGRRHRRHSAAPASEPASD